MAIFHLNFKILKRSEGKSSLYLSAYNSRTRLKDEKTGLVFNYEKKKEDLMHQEIILPNNAPKSFKDRSTLWNAVESKNNRRDSQLSRYFIVALPREQTLEQNHKLLTGYIKKNFIKKGMCADIAIHNDADNNNPHAHVMLTMQDVNETGFLNKNREWNNKNNVEIWRRSWAVSVNKSLRENNKKDLVSSLSFLRQKEILIKKANENLNADKIDEAEKYLEAYNQIKDKKPKKRKSRQSYIKRKKFKDYAKTYEQQAEDNRIKREKKKEEMKKENKFNSFFKSVMDKLTNRKKKEAEERKNREIAAMQQWQKNEEKRAELRERLKNENLNQEEINYVDKIHNEPTRDQNYNIPTAKYKI
ncbi:MobA/MobL family protein [Salmonella enterica]|nr:MobA/MobL family protein [Salmonella enterica]